MKITGALLALCALQPWGSDAFAPSKMVRPASALNSLNPNAQNIEGKTSDTSTWDMSKMSPISRIEGQTRRTWNFADTSKDVVQVAMGTEGRPLNAVVELWIGPDWTPMTMKAYSEDGRLRPVQTLVGTRNKYANVEIRNTGVYELPLNAACAYAAPPLSDVRNKIPEMIDGRYVEGGSIYSMPFDNDVEQVQVLLNTDSRQLNVKVELLNGPNNKKQEFEIFTNNGLLNALYVVFNTPGSGNVVRITNIAPLEFPCKAYMSPYSISS